jgi:SNF2 family DNA or RNA helicase
LNDIYPYLRFIGVIDWEDFRNQISSIATRKPRLASRRAQAILRKVMLRRTKDSELGGKKILQLPPKTIDMIEMDFDDEERAIYQAIETAARVKVNKWYKAGTLLKQYHIVLVMLTRLRQFCCHPWLLRASEEYRNSHAEGIVVELDDGEDDAQEVAMKEYTDEEELARAVKDMGQDWVDKVRRKLEQRYQTMIGEQQGDEDDFVSVGSAAYRAS